MSPKKFRSVYQGRPGGPLDVRDGFQLVWYGSVALFLLAAGWPMLAGSPQNPDGAEMLAAAVQGGVLHAPSYPLQLWLDRLLILVPLGQPATRLALLPFAAYIATAVTLFAIFRRLGVGRAAALLGGAFFCFYPIVWYLALQPEKHVTAIFFVALAVLLALRGAPQNFGRILWHAAAVGILAALAFQQHAATLLFAPFYLWRIHDLCRAGRRPLLVLLVALASALSVLAVLDLSLFCATSQAAWPDWGKIRDFRDLGAILLRTDFWDLRPKSDVGDAAAYTHALALFARDYWAALGPAIVLPASGVFILLRGYKGSFARAFLATSALNLVFLAGIRFAGADNLIGETYLERYAVFLIFLLALPAGLAAAKIGAWAAKRRVGSGLFTLLCVLGAFGMFLRGRPAANAAADDTLELFREGLGISNDPRAFYVAGTDLEFFAGMPTQGGTRYPLCADYPWSARVIPLLEPRLRGVALDGITVSAQLTQLIYFAGGTVMISDPKILHGAPVDPVPIGLLWFLAEKPPTGWQDESLRRAAELCSVVDKFRLPRPQTGFRYARVLFGKFLTAYDSVAHIAAAQGRDGIAAAAGRVRDALAAGDDPAAWRRACEEYRRSVL